MVHSRIENTVAYMLLASKNSDHALAVTICLLFAPGISPRVLIYIQTLPIPVAGMLPIAFMRWFSLVSVFLFMVSMLLHFCLIWKVTWQPCNRNSMNVFKSKPCKYIAGCSAQITLVVNYCNSLFISWEWNIHPI